MNAGGHGTRTARWRWWFVLAAGPTADHDELHLLGDQGGSFSWCLGAVGVVVLAEGTTIDADKSKTARAMLLGVLSAEVLLPVSTKPTAKEVWDSLKVRFVVADRVRAARLASLRGEFERLRMADDDDLDSLRREARHHDDALCRSGGRCSTTLRS